MIGVRVSSVVFLFLVWMAYIALMAFTAKDHMKDFTNICSQEQIMSGECHTNGE